MVLSYFISHEALYIFQNSGFKTDSLFYALDKGVGVDCPGIDSYIEQDIGSAKKLKAAKAFQWFAKFLINVIEARYLANNELVTEHRNFREDLLFKVIYASERSQSMEVQVRKNEKDH